MNPGKSLAEVGVSEVLTRTAYRHFPQVLGPILRSPGVIVTTKKSTV